MFVKVGKTVIYTTKKEGIKISTSKPKPKKKRSAKKS